MDFIMDEAATILLMMLIILATYSAMVTYNFSIVADAYKEQTQTVAQMQANVSELSAAVDSYKIKARAGPQIQYIKSYDEESFSSIASEIAAGHVYEYGKYMCSDFSIDLLRALNDAGWTAKIVHGHYYDFGEKGCNEKNLIQFGCRHDWVVVEVPIEATTGEVISPEDYNKYYNKY